MASRFYRFTMKRPVRFALVLCLCLGWALIVLAGNTPPADAPTDEHIKFLATIMGGALGFMAILGGVSRWVALPAARQILAEHIKNGEQAHKEFLPREEYHEKHDEVLDKLAELSAAVRALPTQVLLELEQKGRR